VKIILDDTKVKQALYPFTANRHAADIRIGILTIREKWSYLKRFQVDTDSESFFLDNSTNQNNSIAIFDAHLIPTLAWLNGLESRDANINIVEDDTVRLLKYPWQIFQYNDWAIRKDFEMITSGRLSQPISPTNRITGIENIFIEEGAIVEQAILNASTGPIYIGKNAEIMEGCMIRGPFALCEGAVLKMGTKVYGATTIGPYCVAAGEIKNSVLFDHSNKAHDGYLGDSVMGSWCNLGAGTTNSNLKNTAGQVKVWFNAANEYVTVGDKCGLLMGDYSRSAINTSFNTGSVVGVCCHIFEDNFPPKMVSNFTWGKERYIFEKVIVDINNWKKLKGSKLTEQETEILQQLYSQL
jgi:UDP-N-acetylglucosamine diphosphorylase/glucosamine-1-phosphate N-acetyltransferase